MIEAKDLRVGNWVVYDSFNLLCQVRGFYFGRAENYIVHTWDEENVLTVHQTDAIFFSPIPLTPEILEGCGFRKYGASPKKEIWKYGFPVIKERGLDIYKTYYTNGGSTGYYSLACVSLQSGEPAHDIHYLHQLQNLFYALTGEELQIKIPQLT